MRHFQHSARPSELSCFLLLTSWFAGDVLEVQIPPAQVSTYNQEPCALIRFCYDCTCKIDRYLAQKHRGFAFVTYTAPGDAQDAIDNMDMNELRGRVLRVNLARPQKLTAAAAGNRASA